MARMVMAVDGNLNPYWKEQMNKNFLRPGLFALAALLSFSLMTDNIAYSRDGKGEGRPEIQLTAEQREKAKMIFDQNRKETSETRTALKEKREQLKELMKSANSNRAQAEALCTEIGVLQGKMLLNRYDLSQQLVKEGLPPQLADRKGPSKGDRKGDRKDKRKGDKRD